MNYFARLVSVLLFLTSCSHSQIVLDGDETKILSPIQYQIDLSDRKFVSKEIETAKILLSKQNLSKDEILRLEKIIELYLVSKGLFDHQVTLPPQTKVDLKLPSFCLDPVLSTPSIFEFFMEKSYA